MPKATDKLMEDLHGAIVVELLAKIKSGEATASDLSVARQFLKDNGIDGIIGKQNSPMLELAGEVLPFDDDGEPVPMAG